MTKSNGLDLDFDDSIITRAHEDGPEITEEMKSLLQHYVIMSEGQADFSVIWMIHTHLFPGYRGSTGILLITSPVAECGKSQMLEVTELFVANPLTIGGATAAALIRVIDQSHPTVLFDEADLNMHDKDLAPVLCAVFNNGWRPNRPYIKCAGEGKDIEVRKFDIYGPKALAGVGTHYLQPTTLTRCFPIKLQRHAPGRMAAEYYIDTAEAESLPIKQKLVRWANQRKRTWLENKRPRGVPDWLNSRKKSIAFPLFAIAEDLGAAYTERLAVGLEEIFVGGKAGKVRLDYKVQLLYDIRSVFDERDREILKTSDLLEGLCEIETSPWAEASKGKPLNPHKLASLLSDFEVAPGQPLGPRQHWDGKKLRGYSREDFQVTWDRYLPPPPVPPLFRSVGPVEPSVYAGETHVSGSVGQGIPTDPETAKSANDYAGSTVPTDPDRGERGGGERAVRGKAAERASHEGRCYAHGIHTEWWLRGRDWLCERCHPDPR